MGYRVYFTDKPCGREEYIRDKGHLQPRECEGLEEALCWARRITQVGGTAWEIEGDDGSILGRAEIGITLRKRATARESNAPDPAKAIGVPPSERSFTETATKSANSAEVSLNDVIDNLMDGVVGIAPLMNNQHIAQAEEFLIQELARRRFNTERAMEVFTIAVDNTVWDHLKRHPADLRRWAYANYKARQLGRQKALELLEVFTAQTGARDQRPARRWFRGVLGA